VLASCGSCGGGKSKNTRESSCLLDCSRREGEIMEGAAACLFGDEKQKKKKE